MPCSRVQFDIHSFSAGHKISIASIRVFVAYSKKRYNYFLFILKSVAVNHLRFDQLALRFAVVFFLYIT